MTTEEKLSKAGAELSEARRTIARLRADYATAKESHAKDRSDLARYEIEAHNAKELLESQRGSINALEGIVANQREIIKIILGRTLWMRIIHVVWPHTEEGK